MLNFFFVLCFVFLFNIQGVKAQNFSTHQVKRGETITGISEKYGVSVDHIYKLNPDAVKELKANTILIIPISKAKKDVAITPDKPIFSTEKVDTIAVNINEVESFKEHKTSRKETLYGIAKEYNVTEVDIKKYNTFLYANTLKKGDKLQIPVFKTIKKAPKPKTNTYIVQPKEGKWRIAYKFGITVQELEDLNPGLGDSLQEGQEIIVPNIGNKIIKVVDEKYSYYNVLPKEGFYRLKVKLGLEQEELEALNPELKESGLKDGMVLKIPYINSFNVSGEQPSRKTTLENKIRNFNTKHIAIMLPFRLDRIQFDSISVVSLKSKIKKDPYLDASLDFYSGALTALDSLKKLGISLKVDVYDTNYQVSNVMKILADNNFKNVDAVIGPLTTETFDKVASELRKYNVPVVSPIGTDLTLYDNVFQSRPSDDLLPSSMINFIKANAYQKNIIIISDTKNATTASALKKEFTSAHLVYSRKGNTGNDLNFIQASDVSGFLKQGKNYVFLETQSQGFVSSVLSNLISLNNATSEIILVTTNFNAAFQGDQISNVSLSKLQLHFPSTTKEIEDKVNNSFVKNYTKNYNVRPNVRATKGFDLIMDVVLRLVSSKDFYDSVNSAPLTEYVENKFGYKKRLMGGYYNDATYILKYNNLKIVEAN